MAEYFNNQEKKDTIDSKFKEFSFLIKNCKICKGTGYKFDLTRTKGLVESNRAEQCDCVRQVYRYANYKHANIPSEYFALDFERDFIASSPQVEENKKYVSVIKENTNEICERGYGLYLYGSAGTGKSFAGIEVLKKALDLGKTGYFEFFPLIIDALMKKGFSADPKKDFYNDIFEKCDVLVIDELGKETKDNYNFKREDIARILEINILKKRSNKTTIIVSNIDGGIESLKTVYSPYVFSVLNQKYKQLEFSGGDFRKEISGVEAFLKSRVEGK